MMLQAVHAAAAPLISDKGGGIFDKFKDAMMRIIRPLKQTDLFDKLMEKARLQEAERNERDAA